MRNKTLLKLFFMFLLLITCSYNSLKAQEINEKDPTTFKYFLINASTDDDSVFSKVQTEMNIPVPFQTYPLTVDIRDPKNSTITWGAEDDPNNISVPWDNLSKETKDKLIKWTGPNKRNLQQKKYNYISIFTDVLKNIKFKDVIAPPKMEREILSTTSYINPYLNFFGGEPLGIPIKKSFGFSFQLGTPYSGPLETDIVGGGFHLLGAKIAIHTRIKELVRKRDNGATASEKNGSFSNYNNIFTPKLGLSASYVIPFGNFLEVGYFTTLDSGDYDPPMLVKNNYDTSRGPYMPNHVIVNQSYFNWEFRYPIRTFGSTRAKIYVAQFLGEFHAGYMGRELRVAGSVFDLRMDYTFSSQKRNWQFLWEAYISNIGESFGTTSFALGPSIRITKGPNSSLAVVTALLNARFKLGDFYAEK
ncbi:MAG: hypothetical protein NTY74_03675 [Ignavibacteriae bacterium]|nr:hypothetical protein [Ignavibacteriota bacterium]